MIINKKFDEISIKVSLYICESIIVCQFWYIWYIDFDAFKIWQKYKAVEIIILNHKNYEFFKNVRFVVVIFIKHVITIKIILKSAQFNKLKLTENYYIQKADTLKCMSAGTLTEFTWAAILNSLLHADHISQCVNHNIMMCCVRVICLT